MTLRSPGISVYVHQGRCCIPRQDINDRGLYQEVRPVEVADLAHPDAVAAALDKVAKYEPREIHRPWSEPAGPAGHALGFKTWKKLVRTALVLGIDVGEPTRIFRFKRDGAGISREEDPAASMPTWDPALVAECIAKLGELHG